LPVVIAALQGCTRRQGEKRRGGEHAKLEQTSQRSCCHRGSFLNEL
jgi:hypothetical protein